MKKIKALYTLSNRENIFISKGKYYDLKEKDGQLYIIDNTGEKVHLNKNQINERFELVK